MLAKLVVPSTVLALLMGAATAAPSATSEPPPQLEMWLGRWTFNGHIYQTPFSDAHPDTGIADCTWAANKGYVICDYFSDNPPHDDLAVIAYSPSAKAYHLVQIHKDRPSSSETLTNNGNIWVTLRDSSDEGKALVVRTTFVFVTRDKQTTTVQISADKGQTWTTTVRVTAVKASA